MNSVPPVVHVIDDDEAFRVAVARLLRACGYQVSSIAPPIIFLNGRQRTKLAAYS